MIPSVLGWLLGLVPLWGWGAVLASGVAAVWVYLGRRAGLAAGVAAALFFAGMTGYRMSQAERATAALRAELADAQRDLAQARDAERDAGRRAEVLAEREARNQEILRAHELALATRPTPAECVLSGDDVRSLQRLR